MFVNISCTSNLGSSVPDQKSESPSAPTVLPEENDEDTTVEDEEDTEDTYQEGQWKKCVLCDGYFDDDGIGDILFVQEEPNNQEAQCQLCGKTNNIVQMKGTGEYLCGNACDESEDESEE